MSNEIFFIGDMHFGHRGILEFSQTKPFRPFATIEEHDAELVKRWNSVVGPNDKVYHLGDAVFGKRNLPILKELNGKKRLILGNHDIYDTEEYLKYFVKVAGAKVLESCILTHIPVHESQFPRFILNIHGHLHTKVLDNWRYVNVSCEQINCTPVPYDEIISKWAKHN